MSQIINLFSIFGLKLNINIFLMIIEKLIYNLFAEDQLLDGNAKSKQVN